MSRASWTMFDPAQVKIEPTSRPSGDAVVLYDGQYVGRVKLHHGRGYRCAVTIGATEPVLHDCGRADSIDGGAQAVAYYWWLYHCYRQSD